MRPDEWWKNFGLGQEIDVAGAFIYNGIKHLNDTEYFQHPVDTFEILYNLSVGIERLTKITIILVEHDEGNYSKEFEESLITHNTQELIERLNRHYDLRLSDIHKEFVALLSKFYNPTTTLNKLNTICCTDIFFNIQYTPVKRLSCVVEIKRIVMLGIR